MFAGRRCGGGGVRSRRDLFHFAKTTEFSLSVWLQEQIPNTDTLNSTPTLSRRCRHSAFGIRHSAFGIRHSALGNSAVFSFPRSKNNSSPHVSIWNTISRDRNVRIAPNVSPFLTGGGGGRGRAEEGRRATILGFLECFLKKRGHRSIYRYIIAKQLFIYPTVSASLLLIVRVPRLYLYTYTQLGWRI